MVFVGEENQREGGRGWPEGQAKKKKNFPKVNDSYAWKREGGEGEGNYRFLLFYLSTNNNKMDEEK